MTPWDWAALAALAALYAVLVASLPYHDDLRKALALLEERREK